jgi:hypothetical protein
MVMTSSLACANPSTATSNAITMVVTGSVAPSVSIAANPGNTICAGTNVTFTATPTNGGTPSYQWKLNGNNVGTNSNTYQNAALVNGDVATVVMTSSQACASPTTATSTGITMTVNANVNAGVVSGVATLSVGATALYTSTGTTGGSWSSTNNGIATVNTNTGLVTAVSAGTTNITYTVSSGCGSPVSAFQTLTVTINVGTVHCGPKNDKILVCHNGVEICIALAALPVHLAHGDIAGHCPASNKLVISEHETEKKLVVTAYPNPYETVLKLNINSPVSGMAKIEFYNINGVKIYEMKQYLVAGKSIVTDVKSLSSFKAGIIYKVSIDKYQTNGMILRPSE